MNKEHFFIELKIHLRQLPEEELQAVLDKYEAIFAEKQELGMKEVEITKDLPSPKEIAKDILKELNLDYQPANEAHNGWTEIYDDDIFSDAHHYHGTDIDTRPPDSAFVRLIQVIGIIFLNIFLMLWVIFCWIMLLFCGWLTTGLLLFSPALGIFSVITALGSFGLFQLSLSILFCGFGLIGILIMNPVTKASYRLIKSYFKWNLRVLRGDRI